MKKIFVTAFLLLFAVGMRSYATHLRAGEITVVRTNCSSLEYRITITVYTDTGSPIKFGQGELNFGDGSQSHKPPDQPNIDRSDLGPNIGMVSYSITHRYPGAGRYAITYTERDRNEGVLNISNSVGTPFSIETVILIDPLLGCDDSPRLLIPPIDRGCSGKRWQHNPGAYDPDGDSLSFEFVVPKSDRNLIVTAYVAPNGKSFYDGAGIAYDRANQSRNGQPTFEIDNLTGTITWDAPGAQGEYNIAFLIKQWRKISGQWIDMGYVTRDMQIIINNACINNPPMLQIPDKICVEAGDIIDETIYGSDQDNDNVKLEAFSEVFNPPTSPAATFKPNPVVYQSSFPNRAEGKFSWRTDCSHIKSEPYQVVFKVTDLSRNGPNLVEFKTMQITVVAPMPKGLAVSYDAATQSGTLSWTKYICQNASLIQVWRRVKSAPYARQDCKVGMPPELGYTKIGETDPNTNTYTDNNNGEGLVPGAQYCYRLVAVFPLPRGGESYVSDEVCLPPIPIDRPIITQVTVDNTGTTDGQITVRWLPPSEANPTEYPAPFSYEVYRAEGLLLGNTSPQLIARLSGLNLEFTDRGLNTTDITYNYRIRAVAANGKMLTSATASQVRLQLATLYQSVDISWQANVPWSNNIASYPTHDIYRGIRGQTTLRLLTALDVTKAPKFNFIDAGPLDNQTTYCYYVTTRGSYGNPNITEPILNNSQIACAQPNDKEPPCIPEFDLTRVEGTKCDESLGDLPCAPDSYSNTIYWMPSTDPVCQADIGAYRIYRAKAVDAPYELIATVSDVTTQYQDNNLPSYAACYKISTIDRSNNESAMSQPVCFDNCPNYELPNVFTPNGDNCNDLFSAYSDRQQGDESSPDGPCGRVDTRQQRIQCARHVIKVNFVVYNRLGEPVYNYVSGGEKSIYIDWDGRDDNGKALSPGTYYYTAEVTFDVVDPTKATKLIKNWVQILR